MRVVMKTTVSKKQSAIYEDMSLRRPICIVIKSEREKLVSFFKSASMKSTPQVQQMEALTAEGKRSSFDHQALVGSETPTKRSTYVVLVGTHALQTQVNKSGTSILLILSTDGAVALSA